MILSSFFAAGPAAAGEEAVQVTNASVTRTTFYPRVRDGYQHTTTFKYQTNAPAELTIRVKDPEGRTIRIAFLGRRSAGVRRWTWNGKRNNGNTAAVGRYLIHITAVDDNANEAMAQRAVKVATGTKTFYGSKSDAGYWWDRKRKTSSCHVRDWQYDHTVQLDCWGGRYAWVQYGYSIPGNARNVRWSVSGERGCCDDGRVIKKGWRPKSRRFLVRVKVTNWASYTVNRVRIRYAYDKRI